MDSFDVVIEGSDSRFTVQAGETVLNAALRQGIMLPYSCKNGTCASCRGRVVSGTVHYPHHPPLALEDEEMAAGDALFCQAVPRSDLQIQVRQIEAIRDIPVRLLPARVMEKSLLSPTVVMLRLRLPRGQRLQFLAGQYIDILLPGGKRRAFSIASPPQQHDSIELHIRHIEGGDFTGYVFDDLKERDILRLEGPLGTFFLRHDAPERPRILMGGGTGFAPLKAMIEDLEHHTAMGSTHLFWGARQQPELYLQQLPRRWRETHSGFRYTPSLSEPASDWSGFTGHVHEAVLHTYPDLADFDVYMSGPPAMVDAARHAFVAAGLPAERLFYDSFEFGSDVPVSVLRQHLAEDAD